MVYNGNMKRILVICGHPDQESFNYALAQAYVEKAKEVGHEVRTLILGELSFNPNLKYGYRKRTDLEPDLLQAIEDLKWAEHWVWVFPCWWGTMPGIMKGFIDRVFLPGFFFKYVPGKTLPEQLMKGKTAELWTTMNTPFLAYLLLGFGKLGVKMMKNSVFGFCGVKTTKVKVLTPVSASSSEKKKEWLKEIERSAVDLKN